MCKLTKQFSIKTFWLVSFILFGSLFVSENVFSQNYWDTQFVRVTHYPSENSIIIRFLVFDYYFAVEGAQTTKAYLSLCDFDFTLNGKKYIRLMRVETKNQKKGPFTKIRMRFKHNDAVLQFYGCEKPADKSKWPDSDEDVFVDVKNIAANNDGKPIVVFTVEWFLGAKFKKVKAIRLNGFWNVFGYQVDCIIDVDYNIPGSRKLKSMLNQSETNEVIVTTKADAIVITGVENGENIKVYNLSGMKVQSTVTNGEDLNFKLPKNQIYIVNIGEARYKVAL